MKHNKTISMSIRVSEEELLRLKKAAEKQSYSSYSEFVRRTALIEAARVLDSTEVLNLHNTASKEKK